MWLVAKAPPQAADGSEWGVEVNYGSGWNLYGPTFPLRASAAGVAQELRAHGHEVRVVSVDAADIVYV
ncbi:MAG TPA: hypothetical protein VGC78_13485 [Gaiellaceae bacterium]